MRRYLILVCAVLLQMCLGATYSWSVYTAPLRAIVQGLSQKDSQIPFSVFYFVFPAVTMISGFMLRKLGPRICATAGGMIFGMGWLLASLGGYGFAYTVLGIGLLAGIGAGLAYVVPIAACIQWFPERRGLVTGIAVAGFGGGAALVSHVAGRLLDANTPFHVFRILGLCFIVIAGLSGLAMADAPDHTENRDARKPDLRRILTSGPFQILYIAMLTGLVAGLAVNGNLTRISPDLALKLGVRAVAAFAIANALGRVLWGLAADLAPSSWVIASNLLCQAVVLLAFRPLVNTATGYLVFAALAGFNYGGVLVLYASAIAYRFGNREVGRIYPILFSANIPAAIAPAFVGGAYDATGSFAPALQLIAMTVIAAAAIVLALSRKASSGT